MKKGTFKVSFVEPQIGQPQEQQLQEQRASNREEDQHQAADIRWHTVNQPKRKWERKKEGLTTTSNDAVASASAGNSIDITGRSLEPPVNPPNHQTSLQPIVKKGSKLLRIRNLGWSQHRAGNYGCAEPKTSKILSLLIN